MSVLTLKTCTNILADFCEDFLNKWPLSDRISDPHHFNAYPDPSFYINADPELIFNLNADGIRILLRIKAMQICDHWTSCTLHGSILSLQASIVSVHGPPWLFFEPLELLNFDFNVDPNPDPDLYSKAGFGSRSGSCFPK